MQFDSSYITTAGSDLFARATASINGGESTPIVWGSVYTSSVDMHDKTAAQMRALTDNTFGAKSSSGNVTRATTDIVDGNHVVNLECELKNNQYNGTAYVIGVYARLEGDPVEDEVLAAVARVDVPGSTPTVVPSTGEFLATINFVLTIRDDQINTISAPAGYYAPAQSLQDLANRVVTTHTASSITTGENQSIYGVKKFYNNTEHLGKIIPIGTTDIGSTNDRWSTIYATTFNGTTFTGNSATATKLNTARYIDGISFDGSSNITHYCECTTAADTATKEVSISGISIQQGTVIIVKFKETNTAVDPTLKINGGTAYQMYLHRVDDASSSSNWERVGKTEATSWGPGESVMFVYDNTRDSSTAVLDGRWFIISKPRVTQYSHVYTTSNSQSFPLVFTGYVNADASITAGTKSLYTDSVNSLYYNPSTNTLTSLNFSGKSITQVLASCSTASGTAAKTTNLYGFTLAAGARILVKFTQGNTAESPTLNITTNSDSSTTTGAKNIAHLRTNLPSNSIVPLVYSGSEWEVEGSHSSSSQVEMLGSDSNSYYPVALVDSVNTSTSSPAKRKLYTDNSTTDSLQYNPNTNTCKCKSFDGLATNSKNIAIYGRYRDYNYPLVFAMNVNDSETTVAYSSLYTDTVNSLYYNPNSNTLTCTTFSGSLSGNASSATYAPRLKYNSSATKSFYVNSDSELLCQGNVRPHSSYDDLIDLGSNSYKWRNAYISSLSGSNKAIADVLAGGYTGSYWECDNIGAIGLFLYKGYTSGSSSSTSVINSGATVSASSLRRISLERDSDYTFPENESSGDYLGLSKFRASFLSDNANYQNPPLSGTWLILNSAAQTHSSTARVYRPNIVLAVKVID